MQRLMACCPDLNPTNRVRLCKPKDSPTLDAAGHADWSNIANYTFPATVWCEIKTRGGSENWRFRQLEATVQRIFRMRSTVLTRSIGPMWKLQTKNDSGGWDTHDIGAAFDVDAARVVVEVHTSEVK